MVPVSKPDKATILNRRHVLTEVDCCKLIKKSSRQRSSNLFELAASDGRFRYDIRADQLQLQPNGDFCLIRLDSDILYSSMSKPVCYPKVSFIKCIDLTWTAVPYRKSVPVRILVRGTDFWYEIRR